MEMCCVSVAETSSEPDMPVSQTNQTATRAVIVAGNRTPFVKAFSEYLELDTIALGVEAVGGLLKRTGLDVETLDAVIWGGVLLPSLAPNVAREIVLDLDLPASVEANTVTRACASGLQAITDAVAKIERGEASVIIAGGSDSTSNATLAMPSEFVRSVAPFAMGKASGVGGFFGMLGGLMPPTRMLPKMPKVAERSTGEVMGESAEKMAAIHGVSREEQDALAARSHQRAAAAWEAGLFDQEVSPVTVDGKVVERDTIVRGDTTVEKMARLRPVFAKDGTLTAANSSALTDGASATLIMSEEKARALGFKPLAAFKSWAYSGVDPREQLLKGPALSMPLALERAGLGLDEIDIIDMHEAFAAQVLSIISMLGDAEFGRDELGREGAVGTIDPDRLNVHGGSLALGHPFGATGSRMVNTVAHALARSGKQTALLGICAAGGLGAAAVLERVD
jgi:acetyl-CoA acyltransferase